MNCFRYSVLYEIQIQNDMIKMSLSNLNSSILWINQIWSILFFCFVSIVLIKIRKKIHEKIKYLKIKPKTKQI